MLACENCVVEAYWKEGDGGDGGKNGGCVTWQQGDINSEDDRGG